MYGTNSSVEGYANGIFLAYWLKLGIAGYAIAYHQFGFRLPSLPFDLAFLLQGL
jgi:hypothetical protein